MTLARSAISIFITPSHNFLATFIGGGFEIFARGRGFFRADFRDTMMNLGDALRVRNGTRAGLSHNKTISLTVGVLF